MERNAVIESASIDTGERALLTVWLHLKYGNGVCQSFGGYALYLSKSYSHSTNKNDFAGHFIYRCMEISGVESWDKIIGKSIRVKFDERDNIVAIGHIIEDDWFNPKEDIALRQII